MLLDVDEVARIARCHSATYLISRYPFAPIQSEDVDTQRRMFESADLDAVNLEASDDLLGREPHQQPQTGSPMRRIQHSTAECEASR